MNRILKGLAAVLCFAPALLSAQPSRSIDTSGAFAPPTYDSTVLAAALTRSAASIDSGKVMVAFISLLIDSTGTALKVMPRDNDSPFGMAVSEEISRSGSFQAGRLDGVAVNTRLALRISHVPDADGGISITVIGADYGEEIDTWVTDLIYPEFPPGATKNVSPDWGSALDIIRYPAEAEKSGIEGTVMLKARIDEEGKVQEVLILKSVHPVLDAEAVRVASAMRFVPAERDGVPIKSSVKFPLAFNLE